MRLIERTEKYVVDSEEEAIKLIQNSEKDAEENGYVLGASGYTYKTKKAKGEIIGEVWVTTIKKVLGGVWDDYE
jgi:hypothetical protein